MEKFLGARFFIANVEVGEIGDFGFLELRAIRRMYGSSDFQVYQSQSSYWTWGRKIESIFYPFRSELLAPLVSRRITMIQKMRVLHFLLCINTLCYFSWLNLSIMGFFRYTNFKKVSSVSIIWVLKFETHSSF